MIENEENLINKAKLGDSASFGKLYDAYLPGIYRFIFLKIGQKEEAEDLAHQVFLSAWQNIPSYEVKNTPFGSWLYRIARNKVIDTYRLSRSFVDLETVEAELADKRNLAEETDQSMTMSKVIQALHSLPSEHQDVLIMRFIEDLPIKEVALALKKSIGAVKLIQFRALHKLKKILENK